MKTKYLLLSTFILSVGLNSCIDKDNNTTADVEIKFSRFEIDFFNMDSLKLDSSIIVLAEKYPFFFMQPNAVEVNKLNYLDDDVLRASYDSLIHIYPNLNDLENDLKELISHYSYYFPSDKYECFTYVSRFDILNKIIATDSVAFIALDCYLGADFSAYSAYPKYIAERLKKEFILSDLAIELAKLKVQKKSNNLTYLEEMIYQGKLYHLAALFLPNQEKKNLMGYTEEQLKWCKRNEENMWKYYIDKDLLFNSSVELKSRFINEAPFSKFYLTIDKDSPGRTGCWMGWQIIDSYMENNGVSVTELIQISEAQGVLRKSKYKPKKYE